MDMDQIELDAAYDQRFYAPMGDQIQKRVASISRCSSRCGSSKSSITGWRRRSNEES